MIHETDFLIKQGTDWCRSLIIKTNDEHPVNLTGYTAKMQIRKTKDKNSVLFDELTIENDRIIIFPLDGKITFKIPSGISDNYNFINAYYDLEIYINDFVGRVLQGKILIDKNVTD